MDQTAAHQSPSNTEPALIKAPELTIESPIAISSARHDMIHSDSTHNLSETLNRGMNIETSPEATLDDDGVVKKDRDKLTQNPPASHQQQLPFDHGLEQRPTHTEPAQTKATELEIEAPEIDLGELLH